MQPTKPKIGINVFISSVYEDQELCRKLEEHLSPLKQSGKIVLWQEQEIPPGTNWEDQITTHLGEADLVLLLVSASFMASEYHWNTVVKTALERHEARTAQVIPILLRPALWQDTPIGKLQPLPAGAKPVTQWLDPDAALENVVRGIRDIVEGFRTTVPSAGLPPAEETRTDAPAHPAPLPRVDWGDALAVPLFYGRDQERALLFQWIVQERCRVVSVLGIGGIGKSALTVSTMYQIAGHFEVVIFRSLRDTPSCETLLVECLQVLSQEPLSTLPSTPEGRMSLLLSHLRKTRALVVLDNLECLLEAGNTRGNLRPSFEEYGLLLHRVAETDHQSCLLITSREKLADLRKLEGKRSPVRALRLAELDVAACKQLLEEKGIVGTESEQESLISIYAGNPLALKIVAGTIVDLFSGEIGPFLARGTVIFGGITDLLREQFARLSVLEQSMLYWLAIVREPVIIDELIALLITPLPDALVLEAIDAGHRRSLIEQGKRKGSFTLQSVVLEYVTADLIAEASQEIQQGLLHRLIRHGLSQAHAKEYVRLTQERLLLSPLLTSLQCVYEQRTELEKQLLDLLDELRAKANAAQGYGPTNLIALLGLLRGHLSGLDLSKLSIRGAYLQSVEMHDASLAEALIRDTVLTEAVNATWAVAIAPSGKWWAAGSLQGQVRVWEEGSRTLHRIWKAHENIVQSLAFSPDGRRLASGGTDDTVKLWDIESGALLWTGWQRNVQSLVFTPDGGLLASAGADATVRFWETGNHGTGLRSATFQALAHASFVYAVAFSPDGHLLASGCMDGQLRLWERQETGACTYVEVLSFQTSWITSLVFSPDGRTLATAHQDQTVRLWEVGSLRLLQTLSELQAKYLAWSSDGRTLACSGSDKVIWFWDVQTDRCRAVLHGHTGSIRSMAFAPDSSQLLSGSADGTLRVWSVENCQCIHAIAGYGFSLMDLSWSPDGTHLVSGGTDTSVSIWDVSGQTPPRVLRGHTWLVFGVGWSPDGRLVASCSWDKTTRLWNPYSHTSVQRFEIQAVASCMAWSPDGSRLACGTLGQGMQVWDVREGCLCFVGQPYLTMFYRVAWSPDGTKLVGSSDDGSVYLWESMDGTLQRRLLGHHGWVTDVVWSSDGTRLVSSSHGKGKGELFLWDVLTGERVQTFAGHPDQVSAVVWSPNEEQLISGGGDGMLRWWDVETAECVCMQEAYHGVIRCLKVSPDGKFLVSGGDDGAIRIWDMESHEHLRTLRRDRPYERLNITGIRGLNEAQKASLQDLGAIEREVVSSL